MSKKLIASDFDGTFLRGGIVGPEDLAEIKRWRAAGRYFGFATGRGIDFFDTLASLGIPYDFLILYNGALIADASGKILREELIPRAVFQKLDAFFAAIPTAISSSKTDENEFYYQYYAQLPSPQEALTVADKINLQLGDEVTAFVNGHHINVAQKGASKANGIRFALTHFGLTETQGAAVGDDWNDLDMILSLDGWAVETASESIRAQAPHICASVGALAKSLL